MISSSGLRLKSDIFIYISWLNGSFSKVMVRMKKKTAVNQDLANGTNMITWIVTFLFVFTSIQLLEKTSWQKQAFSRQKKFNDKKT